MFTRMISICLLLITFGTFAKGQDSTDLKQKPFHLSIITPLSTNGTQSVSSVNNFSLNMFFGYSGALKGVEFGSLINMEKEYVKGAQFAGIANVNLGWTKGAQFSNTLNYSGGKLKGSQFGGIANVALKDATGLQVANVGNFANKNVDGAQFAGVINYARRINGAQVSGVINVAKNVNGLQFGLINVADTVENGAPVGLLSFVKDGYNHIEVGGSEAFHGYGSAKFGVAHFYNIFSFGKQFINDKRRWGVGYGFGSKVDLKKQWSFNIDAISYVVNESSDWTESLNQLNTLKLNVNYQIGIFEIFGGPSLNLVTSKYDRGEGKIGSTIGPEPFYKTTKNDINYRMWVGGSFGIRL